MINAHKLFNTTRASASSSSAKKAKEFNFGSFIHPLFGTQDEGFADTVVNMLNTLELEQKEMVASLSTFRPAQTVFELKGKNADNLAAIVMESKRALHSDVSSCTWTP